MGAIPRAGSRMRAHVRARCCRTTTAGPGMTKAGPDVPDRPCLPALTAASPSEINSGGRDPVSSDLDPSDPESTGPGPSDPDSIGLVSIGPVSIAPVWYGRPASVVDGAGCPPARSASREHQKGYGHR